MPAWNNVIMPKKLIAIIVLLGFVLSIVGPVFARDLDDTTTKVRWISSHELGGAIDLEVTGSDDEDAYPAGTVLHGKFTEHREKRRISRSEIVKVEISTATLPNGSIEKVGEIIKIIPRSKHRNMRWAGNAAFAATGLTLAITTDMFTLGLPIGRGGLAAWNAVLDASETDGSKLKAGAKGFVKGALMPLPWLIGRGRDLNLTQGSIIEIDDGGDKYTVAYKLN